MISRDTTFAERDEAIASRDFHIANSTALRSYTHGLVTKMSTYIDDHSATLQMTVDVLGRMEAEWTTLTAAPPSSKRDVMLVLLTRLSLGP